MIEEKYLKMAISIRRTYLKLINNLDLYHNRALKVSSNLEETLSKLDKIQDGLDSKDIKTSNKETLDKILDILQEVEDEGKKLETLIEPVNAEIEKLYNKLIDSGISIHPNGKLEKKPWNQMEFSIIDTNGTLLTFGQFV